MSRVAPLDATSGGVAAIAPFFARMDSLPPKECIECGDTITEDWILQRPAGAHICGECEIARDAVRERRRARVRAALTIAGAFVAVSVAIWALVQNVN